MSNCPTVWKHLLLRKYTRHFGHLNLPYDVKRNVHLYFFYIVDEKINSVLMSSNIMKESNYVRQVNEIIMVSSNFITKTSTVREAFLTISCYGGESRTGPEEPWYFSARCSVYCGGSSTTPSLFGGGRSSSTSVCTITRGDALNVETPATIALGCVLAIKTESAER